MAGDACNLPESRMWINKDMDDGLSEEMIWALRLHCYGRLNNMMNRPSTSGRTRSRPRPDCASQSQFRPSNFPVGLGIGYHILALTIPNAQRNKCTEDWRMTWPPIKCISTLLLDSQHVNSRLFKNHNHLLEHMMRCSLLTWCRTRCLLCQYGTGFVFSAVSQQTLHCPFFWYLFRLDLKMICEWNHAQNSPPDLAFHHQNYFTQPCTRLTQGVTYSIDVAAPIIPV